METKKAALGHYCFVLNIFTHITSVACSASSGACSVVFPYNYPQRAEIKTVIAALAPDQGDIPVACAAGIKSPISSRVAQYCNW